MPILHSLVIALVATTLTFIVTLPIVYLLIQHPIKINWIIESLLLLPLVLPPNRRRLILITGLR